MDIVCKIQDFKIGQVSDCVLSYLILSYLILSYLSKACREKILFRAIRNADAFRIVFYMEKPHEKKTHLDTLFNNGIRQYRLCRQFLLWRRKDKGAVLCRAWKDLLSE